MKVFKWLARVVAWAVLPLLLLMGVEALSGDSGSGLLGWGMVFLGIPIGVLYLLTGLFPTYAVNWDPVGAPLFWALGFLVQGLLLERAAWGLARAIRAWAERLRTRCVS
ncbi:hypothetical protein [Corallococcus aberystwythensis]|uniref:Uncharacterized protein n=1 Tax=Corallococcus aberystwythensis TaxID=2316722 RepID=A0A3A8R2Z9_9BACT|nr:hypothetical protein [Corallococcus aberystwythensis]RKH71562.1 hypothetical protein D7W81_07275 [Corallococcus aberystwythensis]